MIIINEKNEIGFDDDGFLKDMDFQMPIVKVYKEVFDLLNQINQYMYSIYNIIRPMNTDKIGCFLTGTYNNGVDPI